MRRIVLMTGVSVAGALVSGCADLMLRSAVAPEWFEEKAREVEGEGYPALADAPRIAAPALSIEAAEAIRQELAAAAAEIALQEQGTPVPTPEEIRASAARLRAMTQEGSGRRDGEAP